MAHIILFDNEVRDQLLPFTFLRPTCELRVGILTIREKWEAWMRGTISYITQDYLAEKFPIEHGPENYVVNGAVCPSDQLCTLLRQMEYGEAFLRDDELVAAKLNAEEFEKLINDEEIRELKGLDLEDTQYIEVTRPYDLFAVNGPALEQDFELLTRNRTSQPLSASNQVIGEGRIFVEEGASVEGSILNATEGPIYIGRKAEVMEGCMIRGGMALGGHSVLKMGTKIYGPTTIGPYCRVGGEVKNSIFMGHSNKSHDGYLGNSVIGEWCNLGADTNASNLKNTLDEVKVWNYVEEDFIPSGRQFCGLLMGDHSRCGINTMFNTGTMVGVCANIFGGGFPRRFIPSFSWGGVDGIQTHRPDKAFESIERMFQLREIDFDVAERLILLRVFEDTARYRYWE